jgi:hypothetical protein
LRWPQKRYYNNLQNVKKPDKSGEFVLNLAELSLKHTQTVRNSAADPKPKKSRTFCWVRTESWIRIQIQLGWLKYFATRNFVPISRNFAKDLRNVTRFRIGKFCDHPRFRICKNSNNITDHTMNRKKFLSWNLL